MYSGNRYFQGIRLTDQKQENLSETAFQRGFTLLCPFYFGLGAENETRTRDPNLGKVVLYQLSYFRNLHLQFELHFISKKSFLKGIPLNCECKGIGFY